MDPDSTYHPDADLDSDYYLMQIRIRILFDADQTFHRNADPYRDSDPGVQIKAQTLVKLLKYAHIPYILVCHLQIDADPDPDPAYHFDADYADLDPDPDPQHARRRSSRQHYFPLRHETERLLESTSPAS